MVRQHSIYRYGGCLGVTMGTLGSLVTGFSLFPDFTKVLLLVFLILILLFSVYHTIINKIIRKKESEIGNWERKYPLAMQYKQRESGLIKDINWYNKIFKDLDESKLILIEQWLESADLTDKFFIKSYSEFKNLSEEDTIMLLQGHKNRTFIDEFAKYKTEQTEIIHRQLLEECPYGVAHFNKKYNNSNHFYVVKNKRTIEYYQDIFSVASEIIRNNPLGILAWEKEFQMNKKDIFKYYEVVCGYNHIIKEYQESAESLLKANPNGPIDLNSIIEHF